MTTECYRFANIGVEITSIYPHVHKFCKDYAWYGQPDIRLFITREQIDYEREKAVKHAQMEGERLPDFPATYLEALTAYRMLSERLPLFDRMMIHGSALALDGQAVLFTAKSGTGKSTHARLWREQFGERVTMINDDKPLLHITPEQVTVYGSPWAGKHYLHTNTASPLKAICFLERGAENKITSLAAAEAYNLLLHQCYRPKNREAMVRTFDMLDALFSKVNMYRLQCNMEREAALVAASILSNS